MRAAAPVAIRSAAAFRRLVDAARADPQAPRTATATPRVWWSVLRKHPDLAVWVAANRTLPPEIVEHLAAHDSLPVRVAIASNPAVSEATLQRLARDKFDLVRVRVVCHARATRDVLVALAADPCVVVSKHAEARLAHDISGVALPASYLDDVSMSDLLH